MPRRLFTEASDHSSPYWCYNFGSSKGIWSPLSNYDVGGTNTQALPPHRYAQQIVYDDDEHKVYVHGGRKWNRSATVTAEESDGETQSGDDPRLSQIRLDDLWAMEIKR